MRRKKIAYFLGAILVVILGLIVIFLVFIVNVYNDIQQVENRVYNLYQEVKESNERLEKFSTVNEKIAQKSIEFTEATKNWQIYQNQEFQFQLKSPASWGNLMVNAAQKQETSNEVRGTRLMSSFNHLQQAEMKLKMSVTTYDFAEPGRYYLFANKSVFDKLNKEIVGECSFELFDSVKDLNIGEVRNCYVYENILNQKYLIFRYVRQENGEKTNELLAVYPRDNYYLSVSLPDKISSEVEYFLQSIVFLN